MKKNRKVYKGIIQLINMEKQNKEPKEKIYSIKVYESVWRILQQIKLDKGFKSMNDLLVDYYQIKEDINNENTK